jgi:hypothetical protein
MRTINSDIARMIRGRPGPRLWVKFHFCATNCRCHRARRARSASVNRIRFPSQPFFEQLILGLEKLDDEQLMPMDPARHNYKQKRQQWRH